MANNTLEMDWIRLVPSQSLSSIVSDMKISLLIFSIISLVLISCTERPKEADAKRYYKTVNPEAEIFSVRMVEDEVACRTFEITHRNKDRKVYKTYVLYFDTVEKPYWHVAKSTER